MLFNSVEEPDHWPYALNVANIYSRLLKLTSPRVNHLKRSQIWKSRENFSRDCSRGGVTYCGRAGFIFCPINGAVAGERGGRTANKSETDPDLSMALVRAQLATLLEDKGRMGAKC